MTELTSHSDVQAKSVARILHSMGTEITCHILTKVSRKRLTPSDRADRALAAEQRKEDARRRVDHLMR